MNPKRKRYQFDSTQLRYEAVSFGFGEYICKAFRFVAVAAMLAIVVSVVFYFTIGSPIEILMNNKIKTLSEDYYSLNIDIDSLQNQLHANLFYSDKYYRELLELDSLPNPIRFAGTGGSEPDFSIQNSITFELISNTSKKINTLEKQLNIQVESFNKIFKSAVDFRKELAYVPAIPPVNTHKHIWISSDFGVRKDPFTFIRKYHEGIDFVGPKNTEIHATADGTVTLAKDSRRGYGKEIVISHGFGYSTRYAHLNKINVKEGQKVTRGELIGLMGNTGRSTGTHLHYEVRLNNRPINPSFYFSDDLLEEEYELIVEQRTQED
ncbi:MAG: M23 family metallopeptidase [Bacteroidales bacterium]|nr:M23 family metallopeptidase [Bacteroidales bacterium]MBN2819436.1 M23 family metallopeptidase [Bacteroidales bacterium]